MPRITAEHAVASLKAYGLVDTRVTLLSNVDCTVYRVDADGIEGANGHMTAVFKIYPEHKQDLLAIGAEVEWLTALAAQTDLRAPRPLAAKDGSIIQQVGESPEDRRCGVLYTWLEGQSLDEDLTNDRLRRAGAFVGALHRHSRTWNAASKRRLDRRTFTQLAPSWILEMPEAPATLVPAQWDLLVRAARRLSQEIATLGEDPQAFGVVHGDLYLSNFLFDGDRVGVLDFSDCAWGHFVDDVATVLIYLKYPLVGNFDHTAHYASLRSAFLDGYAEACPLPRNFEAALATYFTARIFLLLTYVHRASDTVPWVPSCVAQCCEYLENYVGSAAP